MKNLIFLLFSFLVFPNSLSAQAEFETGYIIVNDGAKINCLIKNLDWLHNPDKIEYKLEATSAVKEGDLNTIAEFGIGDKNVRFVRAKVEMDRSSNLAKKLETTQQPIFKEETLFLKVIIDGKASLYDYTEKELTRYFFKIDDSAIEQLVYKRFLNKDNLVSVNNQFRQQILVSLNCGTPSMVDKLTYHRKPLLLRFIKYNECHQSNFVEYKRIKKKAELKLAIKPGISFRNLKTEFSGTGSEFVEEDKGPDFRIGVTLEYFLAFNNRKWSVIAEPTFQSYKNESVLIRPFSISDGYLSVDYTSIELPIGIKYNVFFGKKSNLFLQCLLAIDIPIQTMLEYERVPGFVNSFENNRISFNPELGIGYVFNRISAEVRYTMNRDILSEFVDRVALYNGFSVILGYYIFN